MFALALLAGAAPAQADKVEPYEEFGKRLRAAQEVTPLKNDVFGDSVSLYNGATTFSNLDISIPAGTRLPVELRRTLSVEARKKHSGDNIRGFSEWDLDVPYIAGTFTAALGWKLDAPHTYSRCTVPGKPDTDAGDGYTTQAHVDKIWDGNHLHIPGAGDQEMLRDTAAPLPAMTDNTNPHPWITKSFYRFECLGALKNASAVHQGEGFIAISPQGVKYYFDWMIERAAPSIVVATTTGQTGAGINHYAERKHVMLLPTRVEDRFGQGINYTYSGDKLTRIEADDGRYIRLTYDDLDGARIVQAVSTIGTWNYDYVTSADAVDPEGYRLSRVVQPDGSLWTYAETGSLETYREYIEQPVVFPNGTCQSAKEPLDPRIGNFGLTVTAPSGATATYAFANRRHYRNYIPLSCPDGDPRHLWPEVYAFFDTFSLLSKQITGPGLTPATWTYDYSGPGGGYYESPISGPWSNALTNGNYVTPTANGTFPESKTVTVTGPGEKTEYTFGVQYSRNEGQLLKTAVRELGASGAVRRTTTNTYVSEADIAGGQAFPSNAGTSLQWPYKNPMVSRIRPVRSVAIVQDGAVFATHHNAFDVFANPTNSSKSGVNAPTCTDTTTFEHNTRAWVIGQVKSSSRCGVVAEQTDYHPVHALPVRHYEFGLLRSTLTYSDATGELATVTDGNGRTTSLGDYYLGIPRLVTFPTGYTESAVVNGKGQIASVTDENGYATGYAYDAMGRVNLVTPPAGDSVAWSATAVSFAPVTTSEYGVPAGHWKRVVSRGNFRNVTVYDGLWRPVVRAEWDYANSAGTQRFVRFDYDSEGRKTFASYPSRSPSTTAGVRTEYDALGRVTASKADSELGVLVTRTNHLSGFKREVINPRQFTTTTEYWAVGEPSDERVAKILQPEGVTTVIARNALGNPTAITRSGAGNGAPVVAVRTLLYDANQRLCARIEPETGTAILDYDGADNIVWTATGLALATCDRSAVAAADKVVRTYTAMNLIKSVDVPGTTNDLTYEYWPDGALKTLTSGTVRWDYGYNKLRLPVSETLSFGGKVRTLTHGYNVMAHENSQTLPDGLFVAFAPNALGQPTQAGIYASGVTYFPNGAMRGFNYANGIVHAMAQNARQLPDRTVDQKPGQAAVVDDSYDFDANGNVAAITDIGGAGNRTMAYDGLDRLISTDAPNLWWQKATTTYDALDNIRSNSVGTRTWNYAYDAATNRLASIRDQAGVLQRGIAHDARGNVTNNGAASYAFDYANRLTTATGKESYAYDGHGRRAWINRISDNKASFPMYSLAGQLVTEEDLRSNLTTDYVYLNGSLVAKRSQALGSTGWTTRYIHTDSLGSPVAESDANAAVTRTEKYTPYGEPNDGGYDQGPGFTGHVTDAATGLSYMQQRYYDPVLGRFLSIDPVGAYENPAATALFNRYAYANSNPYRYVDPDGRLTSTLSDYTSEQTDTMGSASAVSDKHSSESTDRAEAKNHPMLSAQQATNIFLIQGWDDAEKIGATDQGRAIATKMYWEALKLDKAMRRVEWIFKNTKGGWRTNPRIVIPFLQKELREQFQTGDHASVEERYAETGAAIIFWVGAVFKPEYRDMTSGEGAAYPPED